jgi:GMP synthase (glutamine-hydrolysing)
MHWHGDTFDLPEGAELLASSEKYSHQAFRYGKNVLAFQFHFEANQRLIDYWVETDPETLKKAGLSPETLREETSRYLPELTPVARQIWQNLEFLFFEEE